jgi:hypothetical protein
MIFLITLGICFGGLITLYYGLGVRNRMRDFFKGADNVLNESHIEWRAENQYWSPYGYSATPAANREVRPR